MFKWIKGLFGSGNDKGIVEQVSDTVDRWVPSQVTKHKMSIEDMKAGDDSQASARKMQFKSHDTWFDVLIDGLNRLPRPIIIFWVIGILFGWVQIPATWADIPDIGWNIIWTVITFLFGARMLFKDIPSMWKYFKK